MIIKGVRSDIIDFEQLRKGDVFVKDVEVETKDGRTIIVPEFYMVIEEVTNLESIDTYGGVNMTFNAVRLSDGIVANFVPNAEVMKVDGELIIKS